jgi:hypothetical protein
MPKRLEIKQGDRYGRLTIIKEVEKKGDKRQVLCKCDCGIEIIARFTNIRFGTTNSCGCYKIEQGIKTNVTHGDSGSRLYSIWHSMKQRCNNKNSKHYMDYGGRGIFVCDEWNEFIPFRKWALENGYGDKLTIDRKNVNGNYEPSNCRWLTIQEQQNNKRDNVNIIYKGSTHTMKEWSDILNIKYSLIEKRIKMGWSIEKTFETPLQERFSHRRIL